MKISLETILAALPAIGPVAKAIPEVAKLVGEVIDALAPKDQETAKAKLAELVAENERGHAELQEKLAAAAKR